MSNVKYTAILYSYIYNRKQNNWQNMIMKYLYKDCCRLLMRMRTCEIAIAVIDRLRMPMHIYVYIFVLVCLLQPIKLGK